MKEVKNDDMIFKDKAKQANVGQWQDNDLEAGFPLTITFLVVFRNLGGFDGGGGIPLVCLVGLALCSSNGLQWGHCIRKSYR